MMLHKMEPPDSGRFKEIDVELLDFKEDISIEIENYRQEMAVELEKARTRLDEMEKNTLEEARKEWQDYENKLEDFKNTILDETRDRVEEIKKRVHEDTVVSEMLNDALREIFYSNCEETRF